MAKISIANLNANESKFSRLPLGETELIKTAVERALDTRRIGGGKGIIGEYQWLKFLSLIYSLMTVGLRLFISKNRG
ncbi:MAG: hypothetical protein EWV42_04520 [Microcystis panniformis Mp_GB_SS_20050300_S99D]|nr:MAG: hypothetical protein EWV42_04520 [Microcystis panniformis Mp_GB_SS_20050300_S99D]